MTQTPPQASPTDVSDLPLAVYAARAPDQLMTVEIEGGLPPVPPDGDNLGRPGLAPLVVQFKVPDPVDCAVIEARGRETLLNLMQGRGADRRLGLSLTVLDENTVAALAPFVTAVESAAHLIKAWNYARLDEAGRPQRAPIDAETVAELFRGRPVARAGWTLQYETASPLERAEGNGFAASPATTSATAANIAGAASDPAPAAPGAGSDAPADPAPAP